MDSHFERIWARKNLSIWVRVESAGAEMRSDLDSAARVRECMYERGRESEGEADFGLLNISQTTVKWVW